jgi:hypothetical protein
MGPIEHGVLETLGIVNWVEIDAWELSSQVQHRHISKPGAPRIAHKEHCTRGVVRSTLPASIYSKHDFRTRTITLQNLI